MDRHRFQPRLPHFSSGRRTSSGRTHFTADARCGNSREDAYDREGDDSQSQKTAGHVKYSWSQGVARARQLAQGEGPAADLLSSYADLLVLQQASFESLSKGGPPSGSLERDLPFVRAQVTPLLHTI